MGEKLEGILLNNRTRLKDLFLKLTPSKEGCISLSEFTKFLKNVRIYPVIPKQDLISAPDLNKLLKRLNTTSTLTYTKFELIMKLIAEQSFNPMAPAIERVKMFIIHIRNYVKMHYQISLSINPPKKLMLETQVIKSINKSASPARGKNNSYRTLSRTNSITKAKNPEILHNSWIPVSKKTATRKESPSISHPTLVLTQKVGKNFSLNSTQAHEILTDRKKHQRSNSSNLLSSKNVTKSILETFENFRARHESVAQKKIPGSEMVRRHDKFIAKVRREGFSARFFLGIVFAAWKEVVKSGGDKVGEDWE